MYIFQLAIIRTYMLVVRITNAWNLKDKLLQNEPNQDPEKGISSFIINIENSEALDIFGVNNENINFFWKKPSYKNFPERQPINYPRNKKKYKYIKKCNCKNY